LQKAYTELNYAVGDFPVSERVSAEIVSLPMFPQLTGRQQARVVEEIRSFLAKSRQRMADGVESSETAVERAH
jgi:dTDP-4-amino-4,6-dideoxygalactose transaminase